MVRRRIDLRRDWLPVAVCVWFGSLLADAIGAYASWGGPAYSAPTWFWGIGGYGVDDALLHYAVLFTALLLLAQLVLQRHWERRAH